MKRILSKGRELSRSVLTHSKSHRLVQHVSQWHPLLKIGARIVLQVSFLTVLVSVVLALAVRVSDYWLLDIFSQFWLQYCWLLGLLSIGFWHVQQKVLSKMSFVFFALMLLTVTQAFPWKRVSTLFSSAEERAAGKQVVTILFANVLYENQRADLIEKEIRRVNPDIVVMTEMQEHIDLTLEKKLTQYPHHFLIHHSFDAFQTDIFSKQPFVDGPASLVVEGVDEPGLDAFVRFGSSQLRVIGIHPTPPFSEHWAQNRNAFMRGLAAQIRLRNVPTVVVGDFNNTQWSPNLQSFQEMSGLKDARDGFGMQHSWPSFFPWPMQITIDQTFVSPEISVLDRFVGRYTGSDHLPVVLKIALP